MPSGVRQVTETSPQKSDGLRRPPAASPAVRRWIQGAVLIVVLGLLAGFGAFRLAQEHRVQAQARMNALDEAVLRDCDRLAAHPLDTTRGAGIIGVDFDQIDAAAALAACRAAFALRPGSARMAFQLGRTIQKAGGPAA